jgi:nonribosomal peptide synthetase DhbF
MAEVLALPEVSVSDNFFALGGHSMMAMTLMFRAGEELGVELGIADLVDAPTVAELLVLVESMRRLKPAGSER